MGGRNPFHVMRNRARAEDGVMPRHIDTLIIHCSATPNGRWTTVEDIDGWHKARGFLRNGAARARFNPKLSSIGYHRVIYTNGVPATGRDINEVGAHCRGINSNSIGICLVGTDRFKAQQWATLASQVRELCAQYGIPMVPADLRDPRGIRGVLGHREVPEVAKDCPGFDVRAWLLAGMAINPKHLLEP